MTHKEKIIATAYTGIMFVDGSEIHEVYAYEEKKLGHGCLDIMHANKDFCMKVRDAVKDDFLAMLRGESQEPIDEEKLTDKALTAAIECNNETDNSMTADQEYWYQQGYYDGYKQAWEDKQ